VTDFRFALKRFNSLVFWDMIVYCVRIGLAPPVAMNLADLFEPQITFFIRRRIRIDALN
jgi:hypothetical protein